MKLIEEQLRRISESLNRISERVGEPDLPKVLTPSRAAKELSISVKKLRQLIRAGKIFTVEIGARQMVPSREIERLSTPQITMKEKVRRSKEKTARLSAVTGDAAASEVLEAIRAKR